MNIGTDVVKMTGHVVHAILLRHETDPRKEGSQH